MPFSAVAVELFRVIVKGTECGIKLWTCKILTFFLLCYLMLVFKFLFVIGDAVGSGSKAYDLVVPSNCKLGSSMGSEGHCHDVLSDTLPSEFNIS